MAANPQLDADMEMDLAPVINIKELNKTLIFQTTFSN